MSTTEKCHLLPTNVRPTHYDLTFTPNLETFRFNGREIIKLDVNEETSVIKLHANKLEITSAKIIYLVEKSELSQDVANSIKGYGITIKDAIEISFPDDAKETARLTFPVTIPSKSKAELHLEYNGELNDNLVGFYKSSYEDKFGVTRSADLSFSHIPICTYTWHLVNHFLFFSAQPKHRYLAATQFEATDARMAFPCWDEPSIKATFDITLIVPSNLTALSNMNVISENPYENNKKKVTFSTTPIMSTYAIAIPDTGSGAMENWGLITFNTTQLLFDISASDLRFKQDIAVTVAHELAHQVLMYRTFCRWDDLWLNEGFATWLEYFAVAKFYPDWDIWTQFVTEALEQGLRLDALETSSHPIQVPVEDSNQISQIFDDISYSKGASVIRMLSNSYLGEEVFLSGVRKYLDKHMYNNATTKDLWDALSEASGKDVKGFVSNWTTKVG
ncbi:12443_t:CDS:2, partial [Acaulospora colombiana]